MPEDNEMVNYATRIPETRAKEVECYRERSGLNKSEAVRHLVHTGLKHNDREEPGPVENLLSQMIAACLSATLILVMLSVIVTATAAPVMPAFIGLLTLSAAASATATAALLLATGVGEWADQKLADGGVIR